MTNWNFLLSYHSQNFLDSVLWLNQGVARVQADNKQIMYQKYFFSNFLITGLEKIY